MSTKKKTKSAPKKKTTGIVKASTPKPVKPFGISKRGVRYTTQQKAEVVKYVNEYNTANGRGGQSQAAAKFGLSVLTVASWLRSPKLGGGKIMTSNSPRVTAGLNAKFATLIEVSDQLRKAETETSRLRAKYDSIRAEIQALI